MSREKTVRGPESEPLVQFARTFGVVSGLLGVVAAAIGVWLGLSGDTVLDQARVELVIAGFITVAAFVVLVGPWKKPLARSIGMGAAAFAYHLFLGPWWLPWIENYSSVVAASNEGRVWEEALALPLLLIGGLFMIVSAILLWPAEGRRSTSVR